MRTAMIRLYDEPSCSKLKIEAPIPWAEAMKEILTGLRAAAERDSDAALYLQWAGYDPYRTAAPLGKAHLIRIQFQPPVGAHRVEFILFGGLLPGECDEICHHLSGEDGAIITRKREWLVTSTLAGILHADGVSLADYVVAFARGHTLHDGDIVVVPATPPTTLYAAVRDRGWSATVEWLRDTQATLKQALDTIREDHAIWVSASALKLPWAPVIRQLRAGQGCVRLALGTEAAAYAESSEDSFKHCSADVTRLIEVARAAMMDAVHGNVPSLPPSPRRISKTEAAGIAKKALSTVSEYLKHHDSQCSPESQLVGNDRRLDYDQWKNHVESPEWKDRCRNRRRNGRCGGTNCNDQADLEDKLTDKIGELVLHRAAIKNPPTTEDVVLYVGKQHHTLILEILDRDYHRDRNGCWLPEDD